jgi:hypothetical protein
MYLPAEDAWIRGWITDKERVVGQVYAPFQRYKGKIRAAQGYLAKMPKDFVERWGSLSQLVDRLAAPQEELSALGELYPGAPQESQQPGVFKPKSEEDYVAIIKASVQRKTRTHERIVRLVGEYLRSHGAEVTTPHPVDLMMIQPVQVIFEAKAVGRFGALFAIRQAVGQIFEYRHFFGPRDARLCILLDQEPQKKLVDYVETGLGLLVAWLTPDGMSCGPRTAEGLPALRSAARK